MDLPSLTRLVAAYSATPESDLPSSPLPARIAKGIDDGHYRLVFLVKELGEALTSDNDATRAKGVGLLSSVVTNVDASVLDRQSTKTLTTFFTDKLSEKACLTSSATALSALTASKAFGTGEGMEVARGIFASIHLKQHPQPIRNTIYTLLDHLMSRSRPALKRLGNEFLKGYAELVEGEKDPRNLMISFGLIRVMLLEFEAESCVEDLFDITFCYFPITFTPPPDDPYGISSEDLIIALRTCLSATPLFGRLALPLFYDKLQAASEKAKRQTLLALAACFPIYGAEASGEWAGRFSEALSIEVFHASDTDMQDLALTTFHSLYSTLYPDSLPSESATSAGEDSEMPSSDEKDQRDKVEGIAIQVVENSLDEFKEPEKNNAKPAVRILTALMAASNRLARYILSVALPPLLSIYKNPDDMSLRPAVLTHISTLLAALAPPTPTSSSSDSATAPTSITPAPAAPLFPPPSFSHSGSDAPLNPDRDDLLTLLTSSTRILSTRLAALSGLTHLIRLPSFLTPQETRFCLSAINEVLSTCSPSSSDESAAPPSGPDEEAYHASLDSLLLLCPTHSNLIRDSTLPLLFSALPSTTVSPDPQSAQSRAYRLALESLADLCAEQRGLAGVLVERLEGRLEEVLGASFGTVSGESEREHEHATRECKHATLYAHHLLSTMRSVFSARGKQEDGGDVEEFVEGFVPRLVGMVVLPTTRFRSKKEEEDGPEKVAEDLRVLVDVGKVLGVVVGKVGAERQATFARAVHEAFHEGKLEALLGEKPATEKGGVAFEPFSSSAPASQQNIISLYSSLLLPLSPSSLPTPLLPILQLLLHLSLTSTNELQFQSSAWLLASLVNKRADDEEVKKFLERDVKKFWEEEVVREEEGGAERRTKAVRVWSWVAKALIVRSSPLGYTFVGQLLDLFTDEKLGRTAATALGIIAEEGDGVLEKSKNAVIRLLYKQRFFTFLLPKLVTAYKDTCGHADAQAVYLIALSSLLQHIPKQLTLSQLPKLLPLLITSLDLPDPLLRANVVDALSVLVKEVPTDVENSIGSVVAKVLKGLTSEVGQGAGRGAVNLRLSSLDFLGTLPSHVPYLTLHSQKATILKELGKAVDDPRRDVRRSAVDCRGKWFLYSA
ncbi:hypothetical protein JCM11641_005289 [Rhodosporidiobolus odoratus]